MLICSKLTSDVNDVSLLLTLTVAALLERIEHAYSITLTLLLIVVFYLQTS